MTYPQRTLEQHLFGPGPKRILALDGGGIRGILTLSYLRRMEDVLRARSGGDPDFRLCDYFDLIGGTSTGAIIASSLALGRSVEQLQTLYRSLGAGVFRKAFWRTGLFGPKFPAAQLARSLIAEFGDITLGDGNLRTGLAVVAKRLDTASPWIIHNNPRGRYYDPPENDPDAVPNRDFKLHSIVRASAAAPSYFEPESIRIANNLEGAFVDGGVSPFNSPALLLLMLSTMDAHGFKWEKGGDRLSIVSVGTGTRTIGYAPEEVMKMTSAGVAFRSLMSLMSDCDTLGQTILQWLSDSPTPWQIDSEIGDLSDERFGDRAWLHYMRYNAVIERDWLAQELGLALGAKECDSLFAMDEAKNIALLAKVGDAAAAKQVQPEHFPAIFDPE